MLLSRARYDSAEKSIYKQNPRKTNPRKSVKYKRPGDTVGYKLDWVKIVLQQLSVVETMPRCTEIVSTLDCVRGHLTEVLQDRHHSLKQQTMGMLDDQPSRYSRNLLKDCWK